MLADKGPGDRHNDERLNDPPSHSLSWHDWQQARNCNSGRAMIDDFGEQTPSPRDRWLFQTIRELRAEVDRLKSKIGVRTNTTVIVPGGLTSQEQFDLLKLDRPHLTKIMGEHRYNMMYSRLEDALRDMPSQPAVP